MEYQGTKEELNALMTGEAIGTAARFVVDYAFGYYILAPILLGLVALGGLCFGGKFLAWALLLIIVGCLAAIAGGGARARASAELPEEILQPAIEKRYPGKSRSYFWMMDQQSDRDHLLEERLKEYQRNPKSFLDGLENTGVNWAHERYLKAHSYGNPGWKVTCPSGNQY
jgi:hypothetical protein